LKQLQRDDEDDVWKGKRRWAYPEKEDDDEVDVLDDFFYPSSWTIAAAEEDECPFSLLSDLVFKSPTP
jgi:hypothetical protein